MKNKTFFSLALLMIVLVMVGPSQSSARDTGPQTVTYADAGMLSAPAAFINLTAPAMVYDAISVTQTDEVTPDDTGTGTADGSFWDLVKANWLALVLGLLGFFELIARLTPTQKDDSIISWLMKILNLIWPNHKAGGGVFPANVKSQKTK